MTCRDKGMAARVLSYQELGDEDRAVVDAHIAVCDDCAQTFWTLDRFVHKLKKSGERNRMGLVHPPEEDVILLAVDPELLSAEQRTKIQQHFERDCCVSCERIYRSVLQAEKENAHQPEARSATTFWQAFFLVWKKPAFALLLAFAIVQAIEIGQIVSLKRQIPRQEAKDGSHPAAMAPVALASEAPPGERPAVQPVASQSSTIVQDRDREKTIADLQEKLQSYSKPPADAAYVLLLSTGRGGDMVPVARLGESKLFVVLQANLSPELGHYERYKLILQDNAGKTVKSDQVTQQQDGTLNYLVRRELLRPGLYTLRISGWNGAQDHDLAQFHFRVAATQ